MSEEVLVTENMWQTEKFSSSSSVCSFYEDVVHISYGDFVA
jgi:hypothetical protein